MTETKHPTKKVEAFGKEAANFTKKSIEGKLVRLEGYGFAVSSTPPMF